MPFLSKPDFKTHLYAEVIDLITHSDDTVLSTIVAASVGLMKSYLNRYDLTALFGTATADPTFPDEYLKSLAKDIVAYKLALIANPNINIAVLRQGYEDAVDGLKAIMKGGGDPTWPLKPNDPATPNDDAGLFEYNSSTKRTNHF